MADSQNPATAQPLDHQPVTVYWRPGCPFCGRLLRALRRSGLPLQKVNIWEDPSAAARVRSVAGGNETVPTVFIGDRALVNPSLREVLAAVGQPPPPRLWGRLRGR